MRVFIIVGTRPEAIKMAPVHAALRADAAFEPVLVSTGQHREMLDQVLDWFGMTPDHDLRLMRPGQSLSGVASAAIAGIATLIGTERPDIVLAQGDTTTVLAAAIAAFNAEVPFGHVEAGLRTHDLARPFPEEGFRQMASRVARWHFCPTSHAAEALRAEAVGGELHVVGNTVVDALVATLARVGDPQTPLSRSRMVLITGHRRENLGSNFEAVFSVIARLAAENPDIDFVYPVHLNPKVREPAFEKLTARPNVSLIEPVPYPEMVALMKRAALILTDSGGIQEETPTIGAPTLVLRDSTERPEALSPGHCELVGADPDRIYARATDMLAGVASRRTRQNPFGDGRAAARIADILAGREAAAFSPAVASIRP
ncbi:MAG: UDP-N-acetylglucosamine 2-epimerase (non-hydrolyzing) [Alphaproteobacteria bacterium]|nr:UDP-N-acetylglucosamine 2-epimerase (non-hydrolyzing) [Alphaproteobacteria bacterium]